MMRMSFILRMRRVVAVVAAILVAACGGEKAPADLIPADRMVDFLTDAYLLEGFYAVESEYRYDALTPDVVRAYDDILMRHGLNRKQVERSFEYYSAHPDLYQPIHDSVLVRLDARSEGTEEENDEVLHIEL